jgi:DMSO/TMAO reductase YedYZ molybdopterin-dependent catalytic subunit
MTKRFLTPILLNHIGVEMNIIILGEVYVMNIKLIGLLALAALLFAGILGACSNSSSTTISTSSPGGEVEATEFMGKKLTPIADQGNNALRGTQTIDKNTYRLIVDGLVENPLSLSYADLLNYPQISKLMDLNCVEGWSFTAKWTGPALEAIFADARVKPDALIAIFHTTDVSNQGYSSLTLSDIQQRNIIIALKLNDITLPQSRGFPFQVVAESKYGYKWAKWIVRIELSSDLSFKGYWESAGYDNNGDIIGSSPYPSIP